MRRALVASVLSLLALALLLTLTLSGCNACTTGSGNITSEARSVEAFDGVVLSGRGNLYLSQNATSGVRIEAEDNILPLIETRIEGGTLVIEMDAARCARPTEPINVYISAGQLKSLGISGFGNIVGQTPIVTDDIEVNIRGSGDVNLSVNAQRLRTAISGSGDTVYTGSVQEHDIAISGRGGIAASGLSTQRTDIAISGSGNANVAASEELNVRISGSGDVVYAGSPRVEQSISGRGSVKQQNATT